MQNKRPVDTSVQIDIKISQIFNYVEKKEISKEVYKVLTDLLESGVIKVHSCACTPNRETYYVVNN